MEDAITLAALAAAISSLALLVWTGGRVWLRAKEIEARTVVPLDGASGSALINIMAQVQSRLERLEQIVDSTALEVERISEAQRYAARLTAGGQPQTENQSNTSSS